MFGLIHGAFSTKFQQLPDASYPYLLNVQGTVSTLELPELQCIEME